jgi:hypothetical protein
MSLLGSGEPRKEEHKSTMVNYSLVEWKMISMSKIPR